MANEVKPMGTDHDTLQSTCVQSPEVVHSWGRDAWIALQKVAGDGVGLGVTPGAGGPPHDEDHPDEHDDDVVQALEEEHQPQPDTAVQEEHDVKAEQDTVQSDT